MQFLDGPALVNALDVAIRLGGKENALQRILTIVAGFLMCWPENITDIVGIVLAIIVIMFVRTTNKHKEKLAG